jgi:hypothetical protein
VGYTFFEVSQEVFTFFVAGNGNPEGQVGYCLWEKSLPCVSWLNLISWSRERMFAMELFGRTGRDSNPYLQTAKDRSIDPLGIQILNERVRKSEELAQSEKRKPKKFYRGWASPVPSCPISKSFGESIFAIRSSLAGVTASKSMADILSRFREWKGR